MKRYIILLVLGFACGSSALAQSINPTVEVTNTYEGKLVESHKPQQEMLVPDSLSHFDVDFNYTVFNNPYKGSYEFKPYLMDVKPQADAYDGKKLYLSAGAGYTLHPELTAVFSPLMRGRFQMSAYDSFRSYFGNYDVINSSMKATSDNYSGYDFTNTFGVEGRSDWNRTSLTLGAHYDIVAAKDSLVKRMNNNFGFDARLFSNDERSKRFFYDASLSFDHSQDDLDFDGAGNVGFGVSENLLGFHGSFGPSFDRYNSFLMDLDMRMAYFGDALDATAGTFSITPKYVFSKNRWDFTLGVKVGTAIHSDDSKPLTGTAQTPAEMFENKSQIFYPDLYVGFEAVRSYLTLYAKCVGGDRLNTYSSLVNGWHQLNPLTAYGHNALMDNTVDKMDISLGVKGNFAARFHYDLTGGYRIQDKGLFDIVYAADYTFRGSAYAPSVFYADNKTLYAGLDLGWRSKDVSADAHFNYRNTSVNDGSNQVFKPAAFTGDFKVIYNWNKRIYAGVSLAFASSRKGWLANSDKALSQEVTLPSYADLGIYAEYQFTRKMSFWLKGGNLLDSDIQVHPLCPSSGIYLTAGLCLNL